MGRAMKYTNETFIEAAKKIHGNLYDYSETFYEDAPLHNHKVYIKHPTLGGFWIHPLKHLCGYGKGHIVKPFYIIKENYIKRTQSKRPEIFQKRLKEKYGDFYDFSKSIYIDSQTPITVICPKHGEFKCSMYTVSCPECQKEKNKHCLLNKHNNKFNTETLKQTLKNIYGDKFLLDKVEYHGDYDNARIILICSKHHIEIERKVISVLKGNCKCNICEKEKNTERREKIKIKKREELQQIRAIKKQQKEQEAKMNHEKNIRQKEEKNKKKIEDFKNSIERVVKMYEGVLSFNTEDFKTYTNRVEVNCIKHGKQYVSLNELLKGEGCDKCRSEKHFIEKATKIHGGKYNYSKVKYKDRDTKVCIICPKHGEFWTTPHLHIIGCDCPKCVKQSKMEKLTENFLRDANIDFIKEHSFNWLKNKNNLRLDFYLPKYNIAIECQGVQHFKPIDYFGGDKFFEYQHYLDTMKKKLCDEHNISIKYIIYNKNPKCQILKIIKDLDKDIEIAKLKNLTIKE